MQEQIREQKELFYPDRDNVYIYIDPASWSEIKEGEEMYMETGSVSPIIMLLKSSNVIVKKAAEFKFR